MSSTALAFAIVLLLVAPGPSNLLLARLGADRGWHAAPAIAAVFAGYAVTIAVLAALTSLDPAHTARVMPVLKWMCALWLLWLSVKLWRGLPARSASSPPDADIRTVFVTTLINPKGLILAVLICEPPIAAATLIPRSLELLGSVGLSGCLWIALGQLVGRSPAAPHATRGLALGLAAFGVAMAASTVG